MKISLVLILAFATLICSALPRKKRDNEEGSSEEIGLLDILGHFMGPDEHYHLFHNYCPHYMKENEYKGITDVAEAAHKAMVLDEPEKRHHHHQEYQDWYAPIRKVLLDVVRNLLDQLDLENQKMFKEHYCTILKGMEEMWNTDPLMDLDIILKTLPEDEKEKELGSWCKDAAGYLTEILRMFMGPSASHERKRRDLGGAGPKDIIHVAGKVIAMFDEQAHDKLATEFCHEDANDQGSAVDPSLGGAIKKKKMSAKSESLAKQLLSALRQLKK